MDKLAARRVPNAHGSIPTRRGKSVSGGVVRESINGSGMTFQRKFLLERFCIPEPNDFVAPGRCQRLAIRGKRDGVNRAGLLGRQEWFIRIARPDVQPTFAIAGKEPSITADRQAADRIGMLKHL